MKEIWLVTYSDWDWHEVVCACATKEIAEREKKNPNHPRKGSHHSGYDIEHFEIIEK